MALGYSLSIDSHCTINVSAIGYTNLPDNVFVLLLAIVSIYFAFKKYEKDVG